MSKPNDLKVLALLGILRQARERGERYPRAWVRDELRPARSCARRVRIRSDWWQHHVECVTIETVQS